MFLFNFAFNRMVLLFKYFKGKTFAIYFDCFFVNYIIVY